ncbi:cytochrome c peroxidase [Verrucomicrobiaceae bacterium 227]
MTGGLCALLLSSGAFAGEESLADLGKRIFLDTSLSEPVGQGCISCHSPASAFADPREVSPGAVVGREGRRNAPSLMYAALIPPLKLEDTYDENGELEYIVEGGLFLDGRAQNQLAQVRQPFFDKNEMNVKGPTELAKKFRKADYADELKKRVGEKGWSEDGKVNELAYRALVEFLREPLFRPFNAPIDDYWAGDKEALTLPQRRGLDVFETAGSCSTCHLVGVSVWPEPLLSDYGYDNIGAPSGGTKDPGLGGMTGLKEELGQFKVPSLRNVVLTAPYLHNGSLKTIREVIEFYNKRDVEPERWGATDYPETVNHEDMGDLKLSEQQVDDLIALMDAFTDRNLLEMKPGQLFPEVPEGVPSTEERKAFFHELSKGIDIRTPRRPGSK